MEIKEYLQIQLNTIKKQIDNSLNQFESNKIGSEFTDKLREKLRILFENFKYTDEYEGYFYLHEEEIKEFKLSHNEYTYLNAQLDQYEQLSLMLDNIKYLEKRDKRLNEIENTLIFISNHFNRS